jgi:hypothetical protein
MPHHGRDRQRPMLRHPGVERAAFEKLTDIHDVATVGSEIASARDVDVIELLSGARVGRQLIERHLLERPRAHNLHRHRLARKRCPRLSA